MPRGAVIKAATLALTLTPTLTLTLILTLTCVLILNLALALALGLIYPLNLALTSSRRPPTAARPTYCSSRASVGWPTARSS